ncbi:cytochrome b [Antarcticimicrobium luteum]|uniref:Cytochrome B n=1 Tax=Antarcticimicrobium luteum TaxID=2547397 RepID=A0A4V3AQC6_9RHOB|nr:cytochrome b/b6 domain-containing protein [Antarcticimicrobium luteum]TDK42187.1 cytochrome B [Antarcticimicrobium luteum]
MQTHYTRAQIALHWGIFLLIALQYLFHEPIVAAWDRLREGAEIAFSPLVAGHVFGGLLILALVVWRIALRLTRGTPPLPEEEPAALKRVAHGTHLGLYGLMLLMPVTGALAWFGGIGPAAGAHGLLRLLLLALVALHVAGALYQQFVLKTGIMARMKRPG